jgi:hypothetical protein
MAICRPGGSLSVQHLFGRAVQRPDYSRFLIPFRVHARPRSRYSYKLPKKRENIEMQKAWGARRQRGVALTWLFLCGDPRSGAPAHTRSCCVLRGRPDEGVKSYA